MSAAVLVVGSHRQQRHRLACQRPGGEPPHVETLGEGAEAEAADDRGDRQRRHRKPGLGAADGWLKDRDLVHQEADLRGQRHARTAPPRSRISCCATRCAGSRRRPRARCRRCVAAAAGRSIHSAIAGSRITAITMDDADDGVGKSIMRDRQHQHRRDQDAAGAGAVQRQAEARPRLAVEPKPHHVGDGADVHRWRRRRPSADRRDRVAKAR